MKKKFHGKLYDVKIYMENCIKSKIDMENNNII